MPIENSKTQDAVQAGMIANKQAFDALGAGGVYSVECVGPDGQVKWTDTFHNLVMNTGVQDMVTDNLLTNQEAFVVLQHWELHILRRKYEAAQNASQSPVPGAKNIVREFGLSSS